MEPTNDTGEYDDPLRQLESWGRKVDRRARRAAAGRRLLAPLRGVAAVGRFLRRRSVIAVVAICVVAGGISYGIGQLPDPITPVGAYPTATPAPGVFATSTTTSAPTGPFDGTPAAHWAEGAAGIALPEAKAVPGFSATTVAAHLALVKRAMVAARLDERMLVRHDLSALQALFAPSYRAFLAKQFTAGSLGTVVTAVDPAAHLAPDPPRVSGRTSFIGSKDRGANVLEVVTNYVWAYPFNTGDVVVVHDEVHWVFHRAGDVRTSDVGLWIGDTNAYIHNMDCDAAARGYLAPFRNTTAAAPGGPPSRENPDSFYAPDHTLDIADSCAAPNATTAPPTAPTSV